MILLVQEIIEPNHTDHVISNLAYILQQNDSWCIVNRDSKLYLIFCKKMTVKRKTVNKG